MKSDETIYIHANLGSGRATAAILVGSDSYGPYARVGVAFCSPKDQFTRKMGRHIAEARLNKKKLLYTTLPLDVDRPVCNQVREVLAHASALRDPRLPSWAWSRE